MEETTTIVIGTLNTDIRVSGISHFPKTGTVTYGGEFAINAGGKSGNIAMMAGTLSPPQAVAMVAKTAEGRYGLGKPPMDALRETGVSTDYVTVLSSTETTKQPSVALLAVDISGNNKCFVVPGIGEDFSPEDIDKALPLFQAATKNHGSLVFTLECPLDTVLYAASKAADLGLQLLFDPGGIVADMDMKPLLGLQPYLVKPNQWEAETITGIEIVGFDSARLAASKIRALGAQNVLITHGANGAYLFTEDRELSIPIPTIAGGNTKDATGCGDQMMAALCADLQAGNSLESAARTAVLAGTLQFYKAGIQPITNEELVAVGV